MRRWQIEESYRFQKCELQIESIRVQGWEPRRKLLLLVTLAYGYGARISRPPAGVAPRGPVEAVVPALSASHQDNVASRFLTLVVHPVAQFGYMF